MFSTKFIVFFAVFAASSVLAIPSDSLARRAAHNKGQVAARYYAQDADLLEDYNTYHERYMDFGCKYKHNTDFFDSCCHPLLKTQSEDDIPDSCYCDDSSSTSIVGAASTSAPVDVAPTVSSYQAAPTTKPKAPKTSTYAPAPTSSAASGGSSGGDDWQYGGQATYFYQNGNAGACGKVNPDSALIGAIDQNRWSGLGNTPNFGVASSLCGQSVTICRQDNASRCVTITIADVCPTCDAPAGGDVSNSIDLSVGAFSAIGDLGEGTIPIRWKFD